MQGDNVSVRFKKSDIAESVPTPSQIQEGDLAFNMADENIYTKFGETVVRVNYKSSDFDSDLNGKTTDDLVEGDNLYFTQQRARDSISVDGDLSYSDGVISFSETYSNASEIKTAYESNDDTNAFTDNLQSKLNSIEEGAQVNVGDEFSVSGDYTNLRARATMQSDVGLSEVDNTSDVNKPISTLQQNALDDKVDKVVGKELSDNNFSDHYRDKLRDIPDPLLMHFL